MNTTAVQKPASSHTILSESDITVIENPSNTKTDKMNVSAMSGSGHASTSGGGPTANQTDTVDNNIPGTPRSLRNLDSNSGSPARSVGYSIHNDTDDTNERSKMSMKRHTPSVRSARNRTFSSCSTVKRSDFGDYYPDGGWGWVICGGAVIVNGVCMGLHLAGGSLYVAINNYTSTLAEQKLLLEGPTNATDSPLLRHGRYVLLPGISFGISLLIAPLVTAWCRRHSPRLLGLLGAVVSALACLFLSFSEETYQFFISHSIFFAIGSGIVLQVSNVMVGRFFRKRRECAELVALCSTGIGMSLITVFLQAVPSEMSWVTGTQMLGCSMLTVVAAVATFRSTALYHPFRQAILHLQNSKSQIDRKEFLDKPSYWDFSPLSMCSVQMLLVCMLLIGTGIYVPFALLPIEMLDANIDGVTTIVVLAFMGISVTLGVSSCGLLVLCSGHKCPVARQYLVMCAGTICGVSTLFFAVSEGLETFVIYSLVYGWSFGAFSYGLRVYTLDIVKRRLTEITYSFVLFVLGLSITFGSTLADLLNNAVLVVRGGFILAGSSILIGSSLLFCVTLTASHPSNERAIKHAKLQAQLRAKRKQGRLNELLQSSESDASCNTDDEEGASLLGTIATTVAMKPCNNAANKVMSGSHGEKMGLNLEMVNRDNNTMPTKICHTQRQDSITTEDEIILMSELKNDDNELQASNEILKDSIESSNATEHIWVNKLPPTFVPHTVNYCCQMMPSYNVTHANNKSNPSQPQILTDNANMATTIDDVDTSCSNKENHKHGDSFMTCGLHGKTTERVIQGVEFGTEKNTSVPDVAQTNSSSKERLSDTVQIIFV